MDFTQRSRVVALEIIGPVLSLQTLDAAQSALIVAGEIEDVGIRDPDELLLRHRFEGSEGGGELVEPFWATSVDHLHDDDSLHEGLVMSFSKKESNPRCWDQDPVVAERYARK